jgi:hypothetical protein
MMRGARDVAHWQILLQKLRRGGHRICPRAALLNTGAVLTRECRESAI